MNRSVMIVSSNDDIAVPLWHALERAGMRAEILGGGIGVIQAMQERVRAGRDRAWGVIVDVTAGGKQPAALIRELREAAPDLFLLAALAPPDLRTAQAALAAGAWDYLVHPFDAEQIEAAVRVCDGAGNRSAPSGRLICFLPARAGDGASTVALHVAEAAAREHQGRGFTRKVLLVDLDFQASDLAFRLRLEPERAVSDAPLTCQHPALALKDGVCPWRELDVLDARRVHAAVRAGEPQGGSSLIAAAKAEYPLLIADLPPAMYSCSREVLRLADEVYVVCTPEIASVHLARRRIDELLQIGVTRQSLRLVLNRAGSHAWIGAGEVSQVAGLPVSALLANDYAALNEAVLRGGVVSQRSALGRQFVELAREVLTARAGMVVAACA